jgi:peptidoglycan/LPS O-acetylase OafA/YrhL
MTEKAANRIYFSGLNSLRFFAALAVIITHIELLKGAFGFKNYWRNPLFFNLGGLGVYFFFVLSGFLITYLLIAEKERYSTISIKQFYLRRALRIWPLYYLIVILGFFVLPNFVFFNIPYLHQGFVNNFNINLLLYILILPNLAFSIFPAVPNIGQTWSIGVEEQFYIFWPWIILKSQSILKTLLFIIVGLILIKIGVLFLGEFYYDTSWYKTLKLFVAMSKFECMAIGGLGAYFLFTKNKLIHYFHNKLIFLASLCFIVLLIFYTPEKIQDGIHIIYSILFLNVILYCSKSNSNGFFENSIFKYLGKISYGIYMYHFMIIPLVLFIIKNYLNFNSEVFSNIFIYSTTIFLTILLSGFSYHYIERPFINMKEKFSPVKSGQKE